MKHTLIHWLPAAALALAPVLALAQAPAAPAAAPAAPAAAPPPIATTKVPGTSNVYVFRNGGHQAMFVVTDQGVIATDPVAYGRPTGGQQYVDEIRKVTDKPIRYLVYSHHHFDHIAGGKAFKDAGAKVVAHRRAYERLKLLNDPHTVLPDADEVVEDRGRVLRLGGVIVELSYHGVNHSDSTLVMRLPQERVVFIVDTIPVGTFPARGLIDFHPLESEQFMEKVLAMDWDTLIPGHPGPGGRLGTKADVREQLQLLRDASEAMKPLAYAGKCWDQGEREFALPKYQNMPGYAAGLPFLARRMCGLWGRGT
ncbi:MAG TPA: MBL fold metallo-hydrolase [Ramlibacter sp.]|nr:MBL fold metallo-hydrolase [Ramlibacter sp.]